MAVLEEFIAAVGALEQPNFAFGGLEVKVDSMKRNLHSTKGLIVGEAVMMALAPHSGRQKAHEMVYKAYISAFEENRTLLEVLEESSATIEIFTPEQLAGLCDLLQYMGESQRMVDEMVRRVN